MHFSESVTWFLPFFMNKNNENKLQDIYGVFFHLRWKTEDKGWLQGKFHILFSRMEFCKSHEWHNKILADEMFAEGDHVHSI